MRHQKKGKKIDRNSATRKALLRGLAVDLVNHGKIKTTHTKAQMLRVYVERLITKAKKGDLAAKRYLRGHLSTEANVRKIVDDVAPKYKERAGGYTRIIKMNFRVGDGAPVSQIELV